MIDDDILFRETFVPAALHVLRDGADIACAYSLLHADISTLDRLRCSASGVPAEVSISGNAMVLRVGSRLGLFPYIYNEDWLFLWSSMQYGGATVTPFQNVLQRRPRKGREALIQMEQFGEVIVFMLFYQEGWMADLGLLQEPGFVDSWLRAYRRSVVEMLEYGLHRPLIMDALSAIDEVMVSDVLAFANRLDQELIGHYGNSKRP